MEPASPPSSATSAAAPLSPVHSLYRDVLAVTFSFLSLLDLASIVSVSRRWSEAVVQMSGICAAVYVRSTGHCERILQSRLIQHVAGWSWVEPVTIEFIGRLADRVASLTSLECRLLPLLSAVTIRFPPRLRSLTVNLPLVDLVSVPSSFSDGLAALPQLRQLCIVAHRTIAQVSLAFLLRLPALEDLSLRQDHSSVTGLGRDHMDVLRRLPQLTRVDLQRSLTAEALQHLVRSPLPSSLRAWQTISSTRLRLGLDDGFAAHLQLLPSLTYLEAYQIDCIDVLASWPQLMCLEIDLATGSHSNAEIVAALQGCTRLTRLAVTDCALTNEDLALIFPKLSALRSLRIGWLPQLRGLSSLALAPHLTALDVTYCRNQSLRSSELRHLHGLAHLTDLYVYKSCWRDTGDAAEVALLQPPSSVLPKLKSLSYEAIEEHRS